MSTVAMEIDPDPEKQRCEGILAATGAAGADVGAKVWQELFWGCLCQIDVEIYVCAIPRWPTWSTSWQNWCSPNLSLERNTQLTRRISRWATYFRCLTLPSCFLLQIFAKMASGEEAKKQFSILDTGVKVDLPDHFCLERPEDGRVSSSKTLHNC